MINFYWYSGCSTCRKARKALQENNVDFKEIDITENPPKLSDLKKWVKSGEVEFKALLNTSGVDYRNMGMSEKVKTQKQEEILKLLAENGRLLKRPIITNGKTVTVGFKNPEEILASWI